MTTYRYTSPYPAVFMDLTVGTKGLSIIRANEADDQPVGATVVLSEGDVITVPGDLEHAYLEPVETDAAKPPKPPRQRRSAAKTDAAPAAPTSDAPASDEKGN